LFGGLRDLSRGNKPGADEYGKKISRNLRLGGSAWLGKD
jgi:hypothetical protein